MPDDLFPTISTERSMRKISAVSTTSDRGIQKRGKIPLLARSTSSQTSILTETELVGASNIAASTTTKRILPMFRVDKSSVLSMLDNATLSAAGSSSTIEQSSKKGQSTRASSSAVESPSMTAGLSSSQALGTAPGAGRNKIALGAALGVTLGLVILFFLGLLWFRRVRYRTVKTPHSKVGEGQTESLSTSVSEEQQDHAELAELPSTIPEMSESRPELPELKVELMNPTRRCAHDLWRMCG